MVSESNSFWGPGGRRESKMNAAFSDTLFSCPSLLPTVILFCIFSLLRCMLRPFYPCLWPLQMLPFAAALCNLTLLNFISYHVFTSESQVLIWTPCQCHSSNGNQQRHGATLIKVKFKSGWGVGHVTWRDAERERRWGRGRQGTREQNRDEGVWQNSSTQWLITLHLCVWLGGTSLRHSSCPVQSSQPLDMLYRPAGWRRHA